MRKSMIGIGWALLAAAAIQAQQGDFPKLTGPYLGQKTPGAKPEIFARGIVSTDLYIHSSVSFSPDGTEIYWAMAPLDTPPRIHVSKLVNGTWTRPEIVAFTRSDGGDCPVIAPDGRRMFFLSNRPLPGGGTRRERVWCVEKTPAGWGEPFPLGPEINSEHLHWQVSVDAKGNLYLGSERAGSKGLDDVFLAEAEGGGFRKPYSLGPEINTEALEGTPYIAPDGGYLIFFRDGLWISFRRSDGSWTKARTMGSAFDGAICPYVSPDGRFIFFLRMSRRSIAVWWADARIIEELRPGK